MAKRVIVTMPGDGIGKVVLPESVAAYFGLAEGDEILAVDGTDLPELIQQRKLPIQVTAEDGIAGTILPLRKYGDGEGPDGRGRGEAIRAGSRRTGGTSAGALARPEPRRCRCSPLPSAGRPC